MAKTPAFYFKPAEHVRTLINPLSGETLDPADYYCTSGEATQKARQLLLDIAEGQQSILTYEAASKPASSRPSASRRPRRPIACSTGSKN